MNIYLKINNSVYIQVQEWLTGPIRGCSSFTVIRLHELVRSRGILKEEGSKSGQFEI